MVGVMNGPLKLFAKFYLCSICSQNLNECSLARAPQIFALLASSQSNFFISARARKKSQCSACSRMLAKTIRHPLWYCPLALTLLRNAYLFGLSHVGHMRSYDHAEQRMKLIAYGQKESKECKGKLRAGSRKFDLEMQEYI